MTNRVVKRLLRCQNQEDCDQRCHQEEDDQDDAGDGDEDLTGLVVMQPRTCKHLNPPKRAKIFVEHWPTNQFLRCQF